MYSFVFVLYTGWVGQLISAGRWYNICGATSQPCSTELAGYRYISKLDMTVTVHGMRYTPLVTNAHLLTARIKIAHCWYSSGDRES